jgi:hypothetical protein
MIKRFIKVYQRARIRRVTGPHCMLRSPVDFERRRVYTGIPDLPDVL